MSSTSKTGQNELPKLPPLPRKGNRTIYVANEQLWERARALAGKEGLSSVIAKSLADFVATKTAADQIFEKFHFEIFGEPESDAPTEVIGFEGTKLLSTSFDLVVNPFDDSGRSVEAEIEIYRTRLGTLVILSRPTPTEWDNPFLVYETHQSVKDLMSGNIVGCMYPPSRYELLRELTAKLGKDGVTWID